MKIIGVTGGLCTGSATAMKYIEEKGYPVVRKSEVFSYLKSIDSLSKCNLCTELSKKENTLKRQVALHLVKYIKNREIFFRLACKEVVFVEVPFLYECELEEYFDKVVVVTCGPKTQEERIESKYGASEGKRSSRVFSKKNIEEILSAQIPIVDKRKKCDFVIDNNKNIEFTNYQLDLLLYNYYRYSLFHISVILIGLLSVLLPILIKYKDTVPTKVINSRLKRIISKLRRKVEKS
ncbi:dephospho-CoA kinase [Nematocida minor]|uniref:dephospho-CoA kinase n=1 Tax=Nematocida minor TaxID=1912983 RepID=UPI00221F8B95|nr:dephospho-CoA kinase [Nematocida minor]KAI5192827.1 dephospho-CoA kinase [Nematocida minor]